MKQRYLKGIGGDKRAEEQGRLLKMINTRRVHFL